MLIKLNSWRGQGIILRTRRSGAESLRTHHKHFQYQSVAGISGDRFLIQVAYVADSVATTSLSLHNLLAYSDKCSGARCAYRWAILMSDQPPNSCNACKAVPFWICQLAHGTRCRLPLRHWRSSAGSRRAPASSAASMARLAPSKCSASLVTPLDGNSRRISMLYMAASAPDRAALTESGLAISPSISVQRSRCLTLLRL